MSDLVKESFQSFVNENGSSRQFDPGRFSEYILSDVGEVITARELPGILDQYVSVFNIFPKPNATTSFLNNLENFLRAYGALK